MTFRKLALATILTSATALSAHAGEVNADGVIKEDGNAYEDPNTPTDDNTVEVELNEHSEKGKRMISVSGQSAEIIDDVSDDVESHEAEALGTTSEQEVVLRAAEPGTMVRTVDGEVVGSVMGTRDLGEDGHAVVVDVNADANLDASRVVFTVDVLKAPEEGGAIEYTSSMDILRDYIANVAS